jgi:hypothetical protein
MNMFNVMSNHRAIFTPRMVLSLARKASNLLRMANEEALFGLRHQIRALEF